jgi:phosphopantothenoylcysteine synthetase/decarboxylase
MGPLEGRTVVLCVTGSIAAYKAADLASKLVQSGAHVDAILTDRVINELMGKDPSARFKFIMERAEEAEELDV